MHRKSAYILFLAVLGMLVIGIVMLFSTSAYARDSHGDVYFFIKRQAIWVGVGLVGCIFAALVNYQFWQKPRRSFFWPRGLRDVKNQTAACYQDSLFRLRLSACPLCLCWGKSIWEL